MALIAVDVVEPLMDDGRYLDAMEVADILIAQSPTFGAKKGTSAWYLLKENFYDQYPDANNVPEDQRPYLGYLQRVNQGMFDLAEDLGWRQMERSASLHTSHMFRESFHSSEFGASFLGFAVRGARIKH